MSGVKLSDLVTQFDGTGDFAEWVQKLELVAKLQKVDDVASLLPLFLSGGAFAVYQGLDGSVKGDYGALKERLLVAFSADPCAAYGALQQRRLQPGESVDVFLADITRLARLVDEGISEKFLKCAFLAGLPVSVRSQIGGAASQIGRLKLPEVV